MKKIFIPFVIAATTLSFAACQKEASSPAIEIEDELVSLNFSSANPTTKTVADAVNKTILWEKGDKISVAYTVNDIWQNATGDATADKPAKIYVSNGLDTGGETAVFNISASFKATTAGAHQFYSVYPSSCVKSNNDIKNAPSVTMTIADVQTPVENSFDAAADLMIGKAIKTYNSLSEAKGDAIPLLWQRIVSHADITLKGLQGLTENEVITTIVLTADADAKLVGERNVNIQNGDISVPTTIANANILTINGTNLKVNNNNVEFWAAVMPATVKSLNIAVETNKATYTRNIESCNIEFKQNARKGLNVDMSKVERVEKSAGLALPFVDDFSWSTTAKNETDFSNDIKEKSNNKYTEAYKLYTPKSDGEIRIGVRDEPGYISTCALDLSKDFYVEVEAKAYNTDDNARISISVDNGTPLKAGEALTNDYGTYCFNLSAATASSSIKISTDTKRAIITSVKIAEGKSTYVPAPKLTISPEFAKVASNTTKATFAVTSNTKWTVSTTSDWAKISTLSGENNGDVEITFSENTADKERTADIVVKTEDGSITKTFALTQKAVSSTVGPIVLYTLDPVKGKNSDYTKSVDVEIDGITWCVGGNNATIPWRIGGKNITKVDRVLYSKTAYPKALTSIKITFGKATDITVNSCKLIYSTNADFTDSKECNIAFTASSTADITEDFPANAYYKLVLNVTNTKKNDTKYVNGSVQLSKIEFLGLNN